MNNPSILDLCLSDHYVLSLSLPYNKPKSIPNTIQTRNIKAIDMDDFKTALSQALSYSIDSQGDIKIRYIF